MALQCTVSSSLLETNAGLKKCQHHKHISIYVCHPLLIVGCTKKSQQGTRLKPDSQFVLLITAPLKLQYTLHLVASGNSLGIIKFESESSDSWHSCATGKYHFSTWVLWTIICATLLLLQQFITKFSNYQS